MGVAIIQTNSTLSNVVLRITFIAIYNLILTEPAESSCIRDCLYPYFCVTNCEKMSDLIIFLFFLSRNSLKIVQIQTKMSQNFINFNEKIIFSSLSCFFAEIEQTKRHEKSQKKCLNFTHVKKSHFELNQICRQRLYAAV